MKTEIYGTFGPACATEDILEKMIEAGLTGMRLNLSHTTLKESKHYVENYQNACKTHGICPQILIDMQGPELRVGRLDHAVSLEENTEQTLPMPKVVLEEADPGDEVLLDDGKILVQVIAVDEQKQELIVKVIRGGILHSHKSIKIVGKNVKLPALTSHDIENIQLAKSYGVTALMQPFVFCGEDLRYVRSVLREYGAEDVQIFAKIENRLGVENIKDIIAEADVIIIARGDLGNDMPLWELPKVQKEIEAACKMANKPYIVVTQMLASMEKNPMPTRAEVSDIFHAVYHGAWGVMVTGETAVGEYPIEVVRYLSNTAKCAEEEC